MTTLAKDKPRAYELGEHNDLPVIAADIIYEGACIGINTSGYARPLVAGDIFGGFALRQVDNSLGVAGGDNVRAQARGQISLPVTGLTINSVGKPVYASDDDTFTMTAGSNTQIGAVKRWIVDGQGVVEFWTARAPATVTNSSIANGAVSLAKLDPGIKPSHIVVFSGKITWSGGLATLNATVTGALTTDIIVASIETAPTQAAYLSRAKISANDTVALTLSAANTSNDAVISYSILRAAS